MMKKKAVLVTGGAKRVGREICLALATRGFAVAIHYNRSRAEALSLAREIETKGGHAVAIPADLGQRKQSLNLVASARKSLPGLSLLVNNASLFEKAGISGTTPDLLDREFEINFKIPLLLTREFAAVCKNGQVINVLDTRIKGQDADYFAYTLAKKSLANFTELAAKALAPGIRVNGIAPGLLLPAKGKSEADLQRRAAGAPLAKKPALADVINALSFFLDNESVTGQILYINSGEHLV